MSKGNRETCPAIDLYGSFIWFPFHFGYLRWQPSIWPKDVSVVMLTEIWHQRHFKAVLSTFWVHIEVEISVRQRLELWLMLAWFPNLVQPQSSHSFPPADKLGQIRQRRLWKNLICPVRYFDCKTTTMSNTNTFRIHHKNKRQGRCQPKTFTPVERYSCH